MIILNLIVYSKNKAIVNQLLIFFKKYLFYNSNLIVKLQQKRKSNKKITLLKSPHVNKNSQEHFEIKTFKKQLNLKIKNNLNLFIFLKKLDHNMFSNACVKIKQLSINSIFNQKEHVIIHVNNFNIGMFFVNNAKIKNFKLKAPLDCFKQHKFECAIQKKLSQLFSIFQIYSESLKRFK